jgi:phosphoribosylamine--glycine ligase
MKVLIIGSGGRESCLAWKINKSPLVEGIFCAPGNGGTAAIATNVDIAANDLQALVKFAKDKNIDLTVVGPEVPLVKGIVDAFHKEKLTIFGPSADLARLEGSKIFAKQLMQMFSIPTADFKIFNDAQAAKNYVAQRSMPLVIKADGLAAGKGVVVAHSKQQATAAIDKIMTYKAFGDSGKQIIIEDCLLGEEASMLAFTDGETILPLATSQDHKPIFAGDKGPNTGGMGAYSPAPIVNQQLYQQVSEEVFKPLVEGLAAEGKKYKGILYAGLMINQDKPYVLEFNVRFGDPETQAVLPRLKTDIVEVMLACCQQRLSTINLDWDQRHCVCVVLASGGYPGKYEKGKLININEKIKSDPDILLFHAGTKKNIDNHSGKEQVVTNGGRVLNVVALGDNLAQAQKKVYQQINNISFPGMYYREDIGFRALD